MRQVSARPSSVAESVLQTTNHTQKGIDQIIQTLATRVQTEPTATISHSEPILPRLFVKLNRAKVRLLDGPWVELNRPYTRPLSGPLARPGTPKARSLAGPTYSCRGIEIEL